MSLIKQPFGFGAGGGLATQGGVDFDGSSGYAAFTAGTGVDSGSGPFTMAGWIIPNDISSSSIVEIGNVCMDFQAEAKLQLHINGAGNHRSDSANIVIDTLTHCVITHATAAMGAANTKIYVDGSVVAATMGGTGTPALTTAGNIGSMGGGGYFMNGVIAQVGVWSSVLSAAEIAVLYNSGKLYDYRDENGAYTSSADLVHYFMMNEGVGTNLEDLGTAGSDATLQGTYAWTTTGLDP